MAEDANKHLTPVWIVYVDGKRLDTDYEGALQRIYMNDALDAVGICTLEFDTSAFKIEDSGTFLSGSKVAVHLGYKDDCDQVFVGDITDFETQYDEYGHEQLIVTVKNCLYRLENAENTKTFESKVPSEIIREIADLYSISAEMDSFGTAKNFTAQLQKTDYEYVMEYAKKYGKTVYAYDSKIYVKDEVTVSNDDIILEWGKSLISFSGHESLKNQLSSCTYVGWDENTCEGITGTASLSDLPLKIGGGKSWKDNYNGAGGNWDCVITADDLADNEDARNRSIGRLLNRSFEYQTGVAKCEGNYRIHPGMRVNIKYVGSKFSGEYIANRVEHSFSTTGAFLTTVYVKRNTTE
jgi:phage protein D